MNDSTQNDMFTFDESAPMLLYRALDAIMPAYRDLFAQYDLTEQQWRILRVIWSSRHVTSAQLSERTLLSPPSLVSIIDRLEKKNLVERVRSERDRRQTYIVATEVARDLQNIIMPKVQGVQDEIRQRLTDIEWHQLEMLLIKMAVPEAAAQKVG